MHKRLLSLLLATVLLVGMALPGAFASAEENGKVTITKQPQSVTVAEGAIARVTVGAAGEGLQYTWYYKNAGATAFKVTDSYKTQTYTVPMTDARDGRQIYCVVTDKYGNSVQTNIVTLGMTKPVTITKQPQSVAVAEGATAKVTVGAVGEGLRYTWYYKNASATAFKVTDSYKTQTYTVPMTDARDGRQIYCVITDKYGNSVQTNIVTLSMTKPVTITKQPQSVTVAKDQTAKVTVNATGDGLTYKWYFKNAGASKFSYTKTFTGNTYSISSMDSVRDGRQIYCVITDKYGNSVQTNIVTLGMTKAVTITKQPQSVAVADGATAKVTVGATGEGLQYTWYYKNAGATAFKVTDSFKTNTYTITMSGARDGRQVYCVITDRHGNTVKTDTVILKMETVVTITKQPQSVVAGKDEAASVTVSATGEGLTYIWYYKDAGATAFKVTDSFKGATYKITMSASRSGRQVYCVITDKYGNSVQTNTVTLTMKKPLTITKQPQSVKVGEGENAKVTVAATGDGLTYVWYYKNPGSSSFKKSSVTTGTYTKKMSGSVDGCKVYCQITDKYGNKVTTNTVTLSMSKQYSITVYTGEGNPSVVKTDTSGKYTLKAPAKDGYDFAGWETADGKEFSSSGTIKADVAVYAVWKPEGTSTLAELVDRINAGAKEIRITGNITVNEPLFISHDITIYSDGDYMLKRDPNYAGDIFVIGQDHKGMSNLLLHRKAVLTLGGGTGTLTIDGNQSNMKVKVVGSVVFISNSGTLNLHDGVQIINNKKLGNERAHECSAYTSETVRNRAGGAAVLNMNGTVNMYGGVLKGNTVLTESTATKDSSGNTVYKDISCYGGAIYNRGNFYMYGGTISESEALSGGAVYSETYVFLEAGTISKNTAAKYGGAVASSGSANCNMFIGSEQGGSTMTFSGNTSLMAGGAIYSSTDSPIVVYGNTVFAENTSKTNGGAIYTSGGLTIHDTTFSGNKANNGGAIFHNFSNPDLTRRDLLVRDTVFTGNTATNGGAVGLGAADTATNGTYAVFQNCTFKENKASSSDGKSGNGGAIYATKKTDATFTNCTFISNTAAGNGGAMDVSGESYVKVNGITATGNKSTIGKKGAVIYVSGKNSKFHLAGTVNVSGNVAGDKDSFIYVADSTALLYTKHAEGAAWVKLSYSASDVQYGKAP